mmetsp:Transcript_8476/g.14377  ORF Transcript_8476/g.14377 Transcript_8476/m.14377 type:complete len:399 (-) Transcript_8476:654-1850(-)
MDRTDELVSLFAIHGYSSWQERESQLPPLDNMRSQLHTLQRHAATHIASNSQLLQRMGKLIQRKEFSNDPTAELNEISQTFQQKLVSIKRDLEALDGLAMRQKQQRHGRGGAHAEQHWTHILSGLQQQVSADIDTFQKSLRQHGQQVQQRESRVTKFGQGNDQVRRGQSSLPAHSQPPPLQGSSNSSSVPGTGGGYALFASSGAGAGAGAGGAAGALPRPGRNQGVIRRRNNAGGPRSTSRTGGEQPEAAGGGLGEIGGDNSSVEEVNNSKSAADKGRRRFFAVPQPSLQFGVGGSALQQQQQQLDHRHSRYRSEQSKAVEESIGKMGKMFSQMSSLVLAQAETIGRIEDDVEAGLEDVEEAHQSMVYVHEITKGNRGLILKIFGLLVFFIMLFMVWT